MTFTNQALHNALNRTNRTFSLRHITTRQQTKNFPRRIDEPNLFPLSTLYRLQQKLLMVRCVKYIKDREQYKCGWLIGVASVSCDKNATWCRPMWVERTTTTKRRTNFVLSIQCQFQWDGSKKTNSDQETAFWPISNSIKKDQNLQTNFHWI